MGHGFTLVEMLLIAPMIILMIGAFISVMVTMTGEVIATRSGDVAAYDTQNALDTIEQDVKSSGGFLAHNDFPLQNPQSYLDSSGNTTSFENVNTDPTRGTMLILRAYTTDRNPLDPSRNLIYTDQPGGCSASTLATNIPFTSNVVYFIKNNTLWRRTLIDQGASAPSTCGATAWQLPSCTPGVTHGNYCKVDDQRVLDNVASLSLTYYPGAGGGAADATASDTSAPDTTRQTALDGDSTVQVTINTSTISAGRTITFSGALTATRLNSLEPNPS